MGESQSRYSIVERLTQKKLNIIESRSRLDQEVKEAEQETVALKKDLEAWKKDIKEDVERTERVKGRAVEEAEQEAKNAETRKTTKEASFDAQLTAVDKALRDIQEISKTAPQN